MPIVLPLIELAPLADLALGVLVMAGSVFLLAVSRYLFNFVIGALAPLPVVGGQLAGQATGLRDTFTRYVQAKEQVIVSYGVNMGRALLTLVRSMVGPAVTDLQTRMFAVEQNVRALNAQGALQLASWEQDVQARLLGAEANVRALNDAGGLALAAWEDDAQRRLLQVEANVRQLNQTALQLAQSELPQLRADLAAVQAVTDAVAPHLPALRGLEGWEAGVERALDQLGRAETAVAGRLAGLEQYRALLALLAVLGALSASQVAELARTARCLNICDRLGLLDDLPDRVEALENAGH